MNRRELKCGKMVIAVGQEGSLADAVTKVDMCAMCGIQDCLWFDEYVDDYIRVVRRLNNG